jgi:type I restriction enzyme, S subunit
VVMAVGRECKSEELKMKNEELRDKRCKSGYKMTELGEIPEDWEVRKLGDICDVRKEKFNPIGAENAKYIALEHIEQGTGRINGIGNSDETTSIKAKFKKGDILFGKLRPYLKKIWLADFNGVCATEILPLFVKYNYNSKFCFYVIQQDKFIEYTNQSSFGTKMPRTSWNYMREFVLSIPPLKEQQKIASILSSVDEQIEITDSLIEKTKELKKGLMQRLLTKGIGHSRFKDTEIGRVPVEWEVRKLGDIARYINGKAFKPSDWSEEGIPIVRIQNLNGSNEYNYCNKQVEERYYIENNELLFSWSGSRGTSFGPFIWQGGKAVLNQHIFKVNLSEELNKNYCYFALKKITQDIEENAHGSAGLVHITKSELEKFKIPIPKELEQQKIASILSSVDEQIAQYESKKEKLQELKKGLMQKLLTGKIRVKV